MTTDDELLSKMKDYIGRKLDQDSDPQAMKAYYLRVHAYERR